MEDSDDDEAWDGGDSKELEKETQALQLAKDWLSDRAERQSWDAAAEAIAIGAEAVEVDLRQPKDAAGQALSWEDVRRMLDAGASAGHKDSDPDQAVNRASVLRDYSLDDLDPTQRAFADRVLEWGDKVVQVYRQNKRAR